jgi:two-component system, LytTR family, response regulator
MKFSKFTFLVVENAIDVCEGIERRMKNFENWKSLGYCVGVKEANEKIKTQKPDLIFLDWSLSGGSAFEILQDVQNTPNYNPYIIFNTGFQSDHPEIPQEIINKYKVDKYLVKPFWENLRNNLSAFLKEAEEKASGYISKSKVVWMEDERGLRIPIPLNRVVCIIQHPGNPRKKNFYITGNVSEITIQIAWDKSCELLDFSGINYFVTKSREHLVIKDFIEKFEKPFVRVKGLPFKIQVVKDKIKGFTCWLDEG